MHERSVGVLLVCVSLGCGHKDKPVEDIGPPLGTITTAMKDHVEHACTGDLSTDERVITCNLSVNRLTYWEIDYDNSNRITWIHIRGFANQADMLAVYDSAIAPIVPERVRGVLRASAEHPEGPVNNDGFRTRALADVPGVKVTTRDTPIQGDAEQRYYAIWEYTPEYPPRGAN